MSASIGTYGKLGIGATSTVDKRVRYRDEDVTAKLGILDGNEITGTLDHAIELVRDNEIRVNGPVNMVPNAVELSYWLPYIMGGTPTGSPAVSYPLTQANNLGSFYLTIDRVIKVFTYAGCKVARAVFRATQGGPLELSVELIGISATEASAGSFPAITLDLSNGPFIFRDLTMTVAGTTVKAKEFTLTVDNMLNGERFFNSQTLQTIDQEDRKITFETSLPYGDHQALKAGFTAAGTAVVATFTNGGAVLIFNMVKVAIPYTDPGTPGKTELMLSAAGDAMSSGSTAALVTSLNPGP